MFTEERQNAIEKCLREKGKVRVKELSEMFQVTEDCIRKDLKILENAGRLKRTYGGAILSQEYPLERNVVDRRMYNLDKKKVIAAKAFKLIKNNETIFLDVSTTNIELARLIASSGMHVVVVSNMIDILQILAANPSITAIGTGGTMYRSVNGFMGAAASRHKYVVMEREKFYFNESYKYTHFDDISGIITDEFPDDTIVNILRNTGVKLL